jgi:hypothetical protein
MDFSKENIEASEQADFVYADWYSRLPDEKKAEFFKNGFDFVAKKVRHDLKSENPFATEADIRLRFVELTQREEYPEEIFAFIQEKFLECSEKEWQHRFKAMKNALGWSYDDIANFIHAGSGASVKASINRKLPAFAKLAVCVFEKLHTPEPAT